MVEILGRVDESVVPVRLPLAASEVRTGFPSPADDYVERELDLIEHLIPHPNSTYFVRGKGDSMTGLGIYDGDLLIVDRSLEPRQGNVLIISVDGEPTCKQLGLIGGNPCLLAANDAYPPIKLNGHDVEVWGVVTHNVHALVPGVGR